VNPEIMAALNKFDAALRTAVRKDAFSLPGVHSSAISVMAVDEAWAKVKAARVELEATITEALRNDIGRAE
jgi:hypothetical protein